MKASVAVMVVLVMEVVVVVVVVTLDSNTGAPVMPVMPVIPEGQVPGIPETQQPEKMVVRSGKTIPQTTQTSFSVLPSTCACRSSCLVAPSCAAWSSTPLGSDNVTCTTTTLAPDNMTLEDNTDSLYGFKIGKLTSAIGVLEDTDGTVYIRPSLKMNFQNAQDYCAKIPGFHLIMLKTKQHFSHVPYFNNIANAGFLNLQKTGSGALQWGDGTFMTPKEIETHVSDVGSPSYTLFQFHYGGIQYIDTEGLRYVLCQGKTRGTW